MAGFYSFLNQTLIFWVVLVVKCIFLTVKMINLHTLVARNIVYILQKNRNSSTDKVEIFSPAKKCCLKKDQKTIFWQQSYSLCKRKLKIHTH